MFAALYKRHLRWRMTVLFSVLILVLSGITLLVSNRANISNAQSNISANLSITAGVFRQLIESRVQSLKDIARPATSDHAFRQVYSEGDQATLISAMRNLTSRIKNVENTIMIMVDFDHLVLASTTELNHQLEAGWVDLLERAEVHPQLEADGVVHVNGYPYAMVVVPLLIPDPEAWVLLGFPLDQDFTANASTMTQSEITVFSQGAGADNVQIHATTVAETARAALEANLTTHRQQEQPIWLSNIHHDSFLNSILSLTEFEQSDSASALRTYVAIQESLTEALVPYQRLNWVLAGIFLLAGIVTLFATGLLSRSITKPLIGLSEGVEKIGAGDYQVRVNEAREDELGGLSKRINQMAENLEEKERIRHLLGQSVSPEVADELLRNDIQVSGEEREVTVLFADLRNFTALSERLEATELLHFLNDYFDCVSTVIDEFHGVVDKYIGDEVMAIFGAPVSRPNHAELAVNAAVNIQSALAEFKSASHQQWGFEFETGIGINTDWVVVGNMGSKFRNNYTVIGDGVNVASRLESASKEMPYSIIASKNTVSAAPDFDWQPLGQSEIRGKNQRIEIFGLIPSL